MVDLHADRRGAAPAFGHLDTLRPLWTRIARWLTGSRTVLTYGAGDTVYLRVEHSDATRLVGELPPTPTRGARVARCHMGAAGFPVEAVQAIRLLLRFPAVSPFVRGTAAAPWR